MPIIREDNNAPHYQDRIYSIDGECPALPTGTGGNHVPSILKNGTSIRRLTPTECERLQGFPDGWTEYGIDENGNTIKISDTQRYKTLGNAVTVAIVEMIGRMLIQKLQETP